MFRNERVMRDGRQASTTIDHEREMELRQIYRREGAAGFVLSMKGQDIPFSALYEVDVADNKVQKITYNVDSIGSSPTISYRFSSQEEKRRVTECIREALEVFGFLHGTDSGAPTEVHFSNGALRF